MKRNIIIVITLFILLGLAAIALTAQRLAENDRWVCLDGVWVEEGSPAGPRPSEPCGPPPPAEEEDADGGEALVRLFSPAPDALVSSPLTITGEARGSWYFEASFPVRLEDGAGGVIAHGLAQAQGEWMTDSFVPFTAVVEYDLATATAGFIVAKNDNPSGLPELDQEVRWPVVFAAVLEKSVNVYFLNDRLDPAVSCERVFPVSRGIGRTEAVGRAALDELLRGPSPEEAAAGYTTALNDGVALNRLEIEEGVARADFDERLEAGVGGACRVTAIRAQIGETLKQFSTVGSVIISVNGRVEDALQP